jgi:hypothetical protein
VDGVVSELSWEPWSGDAEGGVASLRAVGEEWEYLVMSAPDGVTLTRWRAATPSGDARLHEALANAVRTDIVPTGAVVDYACGMAGDWENGGIGDAILTRRSAWRRAGESPR